MKPRRRRQPGEIGNYERAAMTTRRDILLKRFADYPESFTEDEGAELDRLVAELGEPKDKEPPPNPRRNEPSA